MTRIETREASERRLIDALPVDQAAKDALYRALSRSYQPSQEARSRALAAVMECKRVASAPTDQPAPSGIVAIWRKYWRLGRACA